MLRATASCSVITTYSLRLLCAALFSLAVSVSTAATAEESARPGHKIARTIPPPGATTWVVTPGGRFYAGGFKRWLYGRDYRDLWIGPLEVTVLDLARTGGGLTPFRTGGAGQSISLHFTGQDGRRYTVRSLDKDPSKGLWNELRDTIVDDVLQDMISALLPTGALVVDPLMEATGILHAKHTLVVLPDSPRLGEYRAEFAGLIGMLQVHPSEGPGDTPGFAGSRKISGTEKLWERLEKTPCNRVDARAYLKARLMDFLVGDKDRHHGQWRWARFPQGECYTWLPIPEDRDQAFIDFDGFAMALARRGLPRQIKFDGTYPNLVGLTTTGWEMDRQFLVELSKTAWDSVVTEFRRDLPDSVIEKAVRKLPSTYYPLVGDALTQALKARRDRLPQFARRYYELITRAPEIQATDQDEYAHLEHRPDGELVVSIGLVEGPDQKQPPYFQRTFHPQETREVRLYLHGGDDRAEVVGAKGRIGLRIDGGGGDDTFSNTSQAGAARTKFYDYRGKNRFFQGRGAKIDERPYKRPPSPVLVARWALDWGYQAITLPVVAVNPDLGTFVGGVGTRQYFGYRKFPFASSHAFDVGLALPRLKASASYTGTFRRLLRHLDATVRVQYSGLQVIRFNGWGNQTTILEPASFYEVEQTYWSLAPALVFRAGRRKGLGGQGPLSSVWTLSLGPIVQYADTPLGANKEKFVGRSPQYAYGMGSFGQLGAHGEITYDTRNNPGYTTRGVLLRVAGRVYPGAWDVEETFGHLEGEVRTYGTARLPMRPTLALRVGGKRVWGVFPFHESAFLGGPGLTGSGQVRGLRKNRFAGHTALYGSSELRLRLARINLLVPGELGLFGAADAGRVLYDQDPDAADGWHTGHGGGLWLSFLRRLQTASVAVVQGGDLTGVYLRAGLTF